MFRFSNFRNVQNTQSYRQSWNNLSEDLTVHSKPTWIWNVLENTRVHTHWKTKVNSSHNYLRTGIVFSFETNNKIWKILKLKKTKRRKFSLSGIHQLNYYDCPNMHRTNRSRFLTKFKERTYYVKNNGRNSKYEQLLLKGNPEYGNIETNGYITHCGAKHTNTAENFYLYVIRKKDL